MASENKVGGVAMTLGSYSWWVAADDVRYVCVRGTVHLHDQ